MSSPASNTPSSAVVVEWEIPMPDVKSYCKRCRRDPYGQYDEAFAVVSPSGVAHIGEDGGTTACGIDGTGDDWWWRL